MKKLYIFTKNGIRETTDYKTKKEARHEFEANEIEVLYIYTEKQMETVETYGTYLTEKQIAKVEELQNEGMNFETSVEMAKESKYL